MAKFLDFEGNGIHFPRFACGGTASPFPVSGIVDFTEPAPCPTCGELDWETSSGRYEINIETGRVWGDSVTNHGSWLGPILSERVIDGLRDAGIDSFDYYPVVISEIQPGKLKGVPPPNYFYIVAHGLIDVDVERTQFKIPCLGECPTCGKLRFDNPRGLVPTDWHPDRLYLNEASWDGCRIALLRNFRLRGIICHQDVVELARLHRWTNLRFVPVDASRERVTGWEGVDYFGKKWPPEWYPRPRSEGKSAAEWAQQLTSSDGPARFDAFKALKEFKDESIEPLIPLVDHENRRVRYYAAKLLIRLAAQECSIPSHVLTRAKLIGEAGEPMD